MLLYRLEHITLRDFGIEDADFYNELREIVRHKNKNLNEVNLEKVKRKKGKEYCINLITLLRELMKKPTMKKFCYSEADEYVSVLDFKGLEIPDDVLKELHHFDSLNLPYFLCDPPAECWNLTLYKWTEVELKDLLTRSLDF